MTTDKSPFLTPDILASALQDAKQLFDPAWLSSQGKKRPRDPVHMHPQKALRSKGEIQHAIKYGLPDKGMHEVAEAILVTERSLRELELGEPTLGSWLFYRVLSLGEIAQLRHRITGADDRINKLTGENWQSALHELVVACSYAHHIKTEFIPETQTPTPDIKISTEPPLYIECKIKPEYEKDVKRFSETWNREALLAIKQILWKHSDSFVIRVIIHQELNLAAYRNSIPTQIQRMITEGEKEMASTDFSIVIEPWGSAPYTFPSPVPAYGRAIWKRVLGFDEWDEWHHISEEGEFALSNSDPRFATAVKRRSIICVRAEYLRDNHLKLVTTLKDACRRQLKTHRPGIIYTLIDTELFGLGHLRQAQEIKSLLENELKKVLDEYDRLWRVVIDLTSRNPSQMHEVRADRLIAENRKLKPPTRYVEPSPFIIV